MPEESFEQQARRKVEGFGMEPAPEVWQRIEASLAPKERRRRLLFWWWLLPLCLASGVAAWLVKNEMAAPGKVIAGMEDTKRAEDKGLKLQAEVKKEQTGNSKTLTGDDIDEQRKEEPQGILQRDARTGMTDGFKAKKENLVEKALGFTPNNAGMSVHKAIQGEDENAAVKDAVIKKEKEAASGEGLLLQNNTPGHDLQNQLPDSSTAVTGTDFTQSKEAKPDTAVALINQYLPSETIANSTVKKRTKAMGKGWQAGVMAESGVVSWTKRMINNGKSNPGEFYITLPSNSTSSDSQSGRAASSFHQTKTGISTGVGVVVKKPLPGRFYVSVQFDYRYQQYKVYQFVLVPIPQPYGTTAYSVTSADYHAHFLSLGIYAGTKLWSGKRNVLSAEAGIDNGFLFMAHTQKEDSTQAAGFDKSNITTDFYQWQPQLSVALPFDWHRGDKSKFQIAPFARVGLHTFRKNGDPYKNNHLVSAGVQAVYFFK